jgi:NAD(P)-dependent dehydrogenase (short-subunit alcohol dehydrogenase family)
MRMLLALLAFSALFCAPSVRAQTTTAAPLSYEGKNVLVTGSTDGLGRELALALAADGAHVIVHGRNAERGRAVVDEITRSGKGSATFIAADFASLQATRDFADTIAKNYPKLDLLVNNAGIAFNNAAQRSANADGYELQFVVNYLSGWILSNRLLQNLEAAAPSRIVNVASGSAWPIDFDDVMLEKPDAHRRGYGQSKLADLMFAYELQRRLLLAGSSLRSIAAHPGYAATNLQANLGTAALTSQRWMLKAGLVQDAAGGALPTLYAATAPDLPGGSYVGPSGWMEQTGPPRIVGSSAASRDLDTQRALWELAVRLTGVDPGLPAVAAA